MNFSWVSSTLTKYKTVAYAVVLSLASSVGTLAISKHLSTPTVAFSVQINGPTSVNPGDFPDFTVTTKNLSWFNSSPVYQWDLLEASAGEVPFKQLKTNQITFGVAPVAKQYYLVTTVNSYRNYLVYGYQEPLGIYVTPIAVNGGGPAPNPGPPPLPPTIPDGKFAISTVSYGSFPSVTNKVAVANAIKSNYQGVAAAVRANTVGSLQDLFNKIKDANTATEKFYSLDVTAMVPFDSALKKRIYDLYNAKQLVKLTDYADLFDEIALGLNYIK